jgi:hypothetical protein
MKSDDLTGQLTRVMDLLSEPILTMTDEEIRQEIIEDGKDPETVAEQIEKKLRETVTSANHQRIKHGPSKIR